MHLPEKLTSLRKQKGLTQLEVAEKVNVSRQAVSRWEAGSAVPTIDNLKILRDLYGVSVDYLLNDDAEAYTRETEESEQEPKEQGHPGRRAFRCLVACVAVLVLVIIILIGVIIVQGREQNWGEIIPIGEMETDCADDYPVGTFSIT